MSVRSSLFSIVLASSVVSSLGQGDASGLTVFPSDENLQAFRGGIVFSASCTVEALPRFYVSGLTVKDCEVLQTFTPYKLDASVIILPKYISVLGTSPQNPNKPQNLIYGNVGAQVTLFLETVIVETPIDQYNLRDIVRLKLANPR
ncbi:MAG: hypothetical protein IOD12_05805 [Silvanigrellales bacterium]|nr:hypothetical protein [Silvanigrellales bacterium]